MINQAKAGSQKAEEQLFQILRARFATITKRRVLEKEIAEDVVQEACLTVLEKYKSADFHANFESWAYCILRMKIGNYLQSKKMRKNKVEHVLKGDKISESLISPADQYLEVMLIKCLRKIAKASRRYARVLSFSYQGYIAEEICERMRITKSSLYSILSRSRSLLSRCLQTGKV